MLSLFSFQTCGQHRTLTTLSQTEHQNPPQHKALGKHCMFIGVDQRLKASCHVQENVTVSKWRNIGSGDRKRLRSWSTCYCKGMQYSSQLGDCLIHRAKERHFSKFKYQYRRNINNLRYADDTTLWQKVKRN